MSALLHLGVHRGKAHLAALVLTAFRASLRCPTRLTTVRPCHSHNQGAKPYSMTTEAHDHLNSEFSTAPRSSNSGSSARLALNARTAPTGEGLEPSDGGRESEAVFQLPHPDITKMDVRPTVWNRHNCSFVAAFQTVASTTPAIVTSYRRALLYAFPRSRCPLKHDPDRPRHRAQGYPASPLKRTTRKACGGAAEFRSGCGRSQAQGSKVRFADHPTRTRNFVVSVAYPEHAPANPSRSCFPLHMSYRCSTEQRADRQFSSAAAIR